jgi:hypothetical protein
MISASLLLLSFLLCSFFLIPIHSVVSVPVFSRILDYLFQSLRLSSVNCHVNSVVVRKRLDRSGEKVRIAEKKIGVVSRRVEW